MPTLRVGIAQLAGSQPAPALNVERSLRAIELLAAEGSDLVVLPELAACGYSLDRTVLMGYAEDVRRPGPALHAWSHAAASLGVAVAGGFAELEHGRLFNSVAVFNSSGDLTGVYRKLHLFARERSVFDGGNHGLPIFEVQGARIGILVCFDLRFPEAARILAVQGAELLVVPSAWVSGFDPEERTDQMSPIGQVQAAKVQANLNSVPIVCASYAGPGGEFTFLGQSVAFDSRGRELCGPLSGTDEVLRVVELELAGGLRIGVDGVDVSPLANRRTDVYSDLLGYVQPLADAVPTVGTFSTEMRVE